MSYFPENLSLTLLVLVFLLAYVRTIDLLYFAVRVSRFCVEEVLGTATLVRVCGPMPNTCIIIVR